MTERQGTYESVTGLVPIRVNTGPAKDSGPTYALVSLPGEWPSEGIIKKVLIVIVRDEVPGRGIMVDALPAHVDLVAASIDEVREWLEYQ